MGFPMRYKSAIGALICVLLAIAPGRSVAVEEDALWSALRTPGHAVVMRHALAPGTGDPPNFALGDCSTQRNLSGEGRDQARRIGERFRANGVETSGVFSSQWCRCLETAELLGLGPVEELPSLNSFFRQRELRDPQTGALRDWLAGRALDRPVILVTHQVNVTALTGVFPASGEVVIIRRAEDGEISVVGSIRTE